MRKSIRRFCTHTLCVLLAASIAIPAWGAPGDVMTSSPAPTIGADPPKAREIKDGDASVSTQTGALQYSYAVSVPPGRNGAQPGLALTYSSQAHTYGGIAAGWSLPVPEIRLDTSVSPLKQLYNPSWDRQHFVSTLSGSRPLVSVTEPKGSDAYDAYRAQNDSSYVRYERMNAGHAYLWRARSTDGTTYYFGDISLSDGWEQPLRVPLTRTVDAFGNTVEYEWRGTELHQVRYTSNPAAGLPAFARVEFEYVQDNCGTRLPPGAAEDLRINSIEGKRRLTKIRAVAFDPSTAAVQHTREYTLGYDDQTGNCWVTHGLTRQLASIQESAWGPTAPRVDLPPVKFEYNRRERTFDRVQLENPLWSPEPGVIADSSGSGTRSPGGWPAVNSMLLDFDADGLPDRIALSRAYANECAFTWQKNLGRAPDGSMRFEPPSAPTVMPRLQWETGQRAGLETCALNYQRTKIRNVSPGNVPGGCGEHNLGSYLVYRWLDVTGDGRIDLVAGIQHSNHLDPDVLSLNAELRVSSHAWPSCGGMFPPKPILALGSECTHAATNCDDKDGCGFDRDALGSCIAAGTPANSEQMSRTSDPDAQAFSMGVLSGQWVGNDWSPGEPPPGHPPPANQATCDYVRAYMRCERNPWFIYENQPDPVQKARFAPFGVVKYQQAHLESDAGDSSVGGSTGWSSENHTIQDLDGDGNLDLAVRGAGPGDGLPDYWSVFPGDNAGGFERDGDWPYVWFVPKGARPTLGGTGCFGHLGGSCNGNLTGFDNYHTFSTHSLADLNGDGAADFVGGLPDGSDPQVFFGNGFKFRSWSPNVGEPLVGVQGSLSRSWAQTTTPGPQGWLKAGWRQSQTRLVDVDADGRPDLVQSRPTSASLPPAWSKPTLHINAGGDFLPPGTELGNKPTLERALAQLTTAETQADGDYWSTQRDLIDMDGDGLPEHWSFVEPNGAVATSYRDQSDQPLRLLRKIDNGIGGSVEIVYTPTTNSDVVTQDVGRGRSLPNAQWVVRSMSVKDAWDLDVANTSYKYRRPVWNKDERGDWGFRGFDEVETTRPSGAKVVDTYGFDVDWSGRLTGTRTHSAEDTAGPRTIRETTWSVFHLFNGLITTYHSTDERSWTCANGTTDPQCRSANEPVRSRTEWAAIPSSIASPPGQPLLWAAQQTFLQDGETFGIGDRRTSATHYLYADANNYRLQQTEHSAFEETATGAKFYERWTATFDSLYRVTTSKLQWLTDDWTQVLAQPRTTWSYDLSTGFTRAIQSPNNQGTSSWQVFDPDPTKRFAIRTRDEVSNIIDRTYDPGTGAELTARGPTTAACGAGCNAPMTWTDIDGLGRPRATWVNVAVAGNPVWQKTMTSRTVYTDQLVGGQPTKVVTENRIEYGEDRWTREETRVDGQARPKETHVKTGLGVDAVTTYEYDNRGHAIAVTLPDPSAAVGATPAPIVTYTYGFDSLGRPTWMRRPSVGGAPSGVNMSYDRLVSQVDEETGGEGGVPARKVTVSDVFGRLIEVKELTGTPGAPYASTFYAYDARDTVTRIQNPDGVVTDLHHDFAGRRTRIVRAGRTWSYTYDKDGNIKTEAAPPPSAAQAAAYTTSFAYDVAGRLKSRAVGPRAMSGADLSLFGIGTINFSYDTCPNGQGRLCTVSYPNNVLLHSYSYDAEGNAVTEAMSFNFAGVTGMRSVATAYGPGGRVREHTYADNQTGQANASRSRIAYDDRAMPREMWWQPSGQPAQLVAAQTRNVAGLVTKREARNAVNPTIPELESVFTYDKLTRVRSQTVRDLPSTQLVKQELDYFGHDDPARLRHWLGNNFYNFDFRYDARHQLIVAKELQAKFDANYTFTTAGKLQTARLNAPPAPGSDVVNRDVTYKYGSSIDPEAVSALVKNSDGTALRGYSYDTAGNMVTRTGGANAESFAYDGEDQLRRSVVGSLREEYFYDHGGQRTAVVTRNAANAVQTVRVFLGDTELVFNGSSQLSTSYANLSLGTPVARVTDRTALELQYHGLSSNTLLTVAPNGTVNAGFVYAPYGELLLTTGGSVPKQQRRFNDKFRDDLTALSYYGHRYYDGLLLGWTQADPLYRLVPELDAASPRGSLLYQFALNNPVRYVDPDGLAPWDIIDLPGRLIRKVEGEVDNGIRSVLGPALDLPGDVGRSLLDRLAPPDPPDPSDLRLAVCPAPNRGSSSDDGKKSTGMQQSAGGGGPPPKPPSAGGGPLPKPAVVSANGQKLVKDKKTGKYVKPGPSGKPAIHSKQHASRKKAEEAARKRGDSAPVPDGPHRRGGRHFHPVKDGKEVHDGMHDEFTPRSGLPPPPQRPQRPPS